MEPLPGIANDLIHKLLFLEQFRGKNPGLKQRLSVIMDPGSVQQTCYLFLHYLSRSLF